MEYVATAIDIRPNYGMADEKWLVAVYEDGSTEDLVWLGSVVAPEPVEETAT